jgi:hypothetical protein
MRESLKELPFTARLLDCAGLTASVTRASEKAVRLQALPSHAACSLSSPDYPRTASPSPKLPFADSPSLVQP